MLSFLLTALLAFLPVELVSAQVTPLSPGPNETYLAGRGCQLSWEPDGTGSWKNMSIDLKSGSNLNMTLVQSVAVNIDGTDASLTPFTWPCPKVNPYSAIYFYQFTNNFNTSEPAWTTRFTIASEFGKSSPPENSLQPNGDPIPWGFGQLAPASHNNASANGHSDSLKATSDTAPHNTQHISQAIFSAHRGYQSARIFAGGHASQTAFAVVGTNTGQPISERAKPTLALQGHRTETNNALRKGSLNGVLCIACIALYYCFS